MRRLPEQLRNTKFGFVKLEPCKKKPLKGLFNWQNNPFSFEEIEKYNGNYGVIGGYGDLIIIDADTQEFSNYALKTLPLTFTVKTLKGRHFYFICPDIKKKIILGKNGEKAGEIISKGAQVVGVGCIHPDTNKIEYQIEKDEPINTIKLTELNQLLKDYLTSTVVQSFKTNVDEECFDYKPDYAPVNAEDIAKNCAFIREFKETAFEGNEPARYAAIGVIRHCIDGQKIIHGWCSGHSEYNSRIHKQIDTNIYYLNQKNIGATLCTSITEQYAACKKCKHKDKISSPIQLSIIVDPIKDDLSDIEQERDKTRAKLFLEYIPTNNWRIGKQGIYKLVEEIPEIVSRTPFYIVDKICEDFNDETVITAVIRYFRKGKPHHFKLPLKYLADSKKLEGEFNARSIFPFNKKYLKTYLSDYLMNVSDIDAYKAVNSMGWQPDGTFVFKADGKAFNSKSKTIYCTADWKMTSYAEGFLQKGILKKWQEAINFYNEDYKFKPHLFSLLCALGTPLLVFTSAKGFLLSLTGISGSGKTLAHKVAMSVWGDPNKAGSLGTVDTHTTFIGRMGALKNLPVRLDEATTFPEKRLNGLIYQLVNGRGRAMATTSGSLSNKAASWQTLTLVTTNRPLLENKLTVISEAERNRVLELNVEMPDKIINTGKKIGEIIEENYGLAGELFIKFVIQNKEKVIALLDRYHEKLQKYVTEDKRFWVSCGAIALTACTIGNIIKIFSIDLKGITSWYINIIKTQSDTHNEFLQEARGFETYAELSVALKDYLSGAILYLDEKYNPIMDKPIREIKGRLVRMFNGDQFLYVRAPILRDFIKQYYTDGLKSIRENLGIEDAKHKRFGKEVVKCYKFEIKEE